MDMSHQSPLIKDKFKGCSATLLIDCGCNLVNFRERFFPIKRKLTSWIRFFNLIFITT